MVLCLNTMYKVTTKPLFRKTFTCRYRKNWSAGEWVKPAPTVRNGTTVTITASPKSSSAENAAKCSEGSTGTIVELNLSSGAASAGWNLPDWNATPEPLTSWSFRMLLSKLSTRCLETKAAIKHNYSSTLPQSFELRRQLPLRTSTRS